LKITLEKIGSTIKTKEFPMTDTKRRFS